MTRAGLRLALLMATAGISLWGAILLLAEGPGQLPWGMPGASLLWAGGFAVTGYLIDRSRPDNPIGRLLQVAGVGAALLELAIRVTAGVPQAAAPGLILIVGQTVTWMWMVPVAALGHALGLFPDGRLLSPRWRWPVVGLWFAVVVSAIGSTLGPASNLDSIYTINPLLLERLGGLMSALQVAGYFLFQVSSLGVLASLVPRFRRAQGERRLQMKWVVYASLLLATLVLSVEVVIRLFIPAWYMTGTWPVSIAVVLIPVAIGMAILRYRLYDIDRIVSRTVAYAAVVAVLAAVYAGAVFVLGDLLPVEGDVAVAASTLAVAALFNPLRRRVQRWVDRRFNRSRFDAERVVEAFAGRLRSNVDLESVQGDLAAVVARTVEPSSTLVWIRRSGP